LATGKAASGQPYRCRYVKRGMIITILPVPELQPFHDPRTLSDGPASGRRERPLADGVLASIGEECRLDNILDGGHNIA
jgi:hypothetical protein